METIMLELNVTRLLASELSDFSASVAERGATAGRDTWANAKREAADAPLVSADQIDDAKRWAGEFGAWDADEIAAWTHDDVNALVIQFVSGDIREAQSCAPGEGIADIDWDAYEQLSEAGTLSGNLFVSGTDLFASLS
jgi:hypothetical protein